MNHACPHATRPRYATRHILDPAQHQTWGQPGTNLLLAAALRNMQASKP